MEIDNASFVSVKELNFVLEKLSNDDPLKLIEIFMKNPIDRIDIVFIAGLVLWHQMYNTKFALYFSGIEGQWFEENNKEEYIDEDTEKIITQRENQNSENDINSKTEEIRKKNRIYEVKQYLKQLESLYGINCNNVFIFFDNKNKIVTKHNIELHDIPKYFASKSFSPILYITKENFGCFFKDGYEQNIDELKKKYIESLKLNAFISLSNKKGLPYFNETKEKGDGKTDFDIIFNNLTQRLEQQPAIYAFIFLVLYSKLALHKDYAEKKVSLKSEGFEQFIDKLFEFTRQYVEGLYELAKNIYEHSERNQGMITIRAYDDENEKEKLLETHVFDFGEKGIITKLQENTNEKKKKEKNPKIKGYYEEDSRILEHDFDLKDFITPTSKKLEQQNIRYIKHFGIIKLYYLVKGTGDNFEGEMYISTNRNIDRRDYFPDKDKTVNKTLCKGTSYFFQIPFKPDKIKGVVLQSSSRTSRIGVLGNKEDLTDLMKKEVKHITLNELNNQQGSLENIVFDISIDEAITKEKIDDFYPKFEQLKSHSTQNIIAINLQFKKDDAIKNVFEDASDLLRFLSLLSFEYDQPFIIYNLDYTTYSEMTKLNKNCYNNKGEQEYWHRIKSILLYVKLDDFYFADILFGYDRNEFLFVNSVISKTFPNTITLINEEHATIKNIEIEKYKKKLNDNNNLNCFFKDNMLMPFDILLCSVMKSNNDNEKLFPLFNHNLKTILNNPLAVIDREKTKQPDTFSYEIALKSYISTFDGYHIPNTHFKIGNKLHSENFYYAKRLFQNSFYTTRLAILLAWKIQENISNKNENILLVGYEMYSELLLSLITKFLEDNKYRNVKYFVGLDDEGKFKFKPDNEDEIFFRNKDIFQECKVVIIVPIASTGSTAVKIEEAVKNKVVEVAKTILKKQSSAGEDLTTKINKQIEKIQFCKSINIIAAQDKDETFQSIIKANNEKQERLIVLTAKWYELENCPLCGFGQDGFSKTKTIFGTDKAYLTPALIFDIPKGKSNEQQKGNYIDKVGKPFNEVNFGNNALKYKRVKRNNEFFLFSINSPQFIINKENNQPIKEWLKRLQKQEYINSEGQKWKIVPTDHVILLAPCHETNSEFLNLVNEFVFNSSATIIYHQNNIDYPENFKMLNRKLIDKDTKVFYVDDNLISGKQFFEVYHLFRDMVNNNSDTYNKSLDGAILLRDASSQEIHDRFVRCVRNYHAFVSYNLPPALSFDSKKPLEHERKRYESLRNYALHDVLAKIFDEKELELNVEEFENHQESDTEKEERHLRMFKVTHKVYEYFNNNIKQLDGDKLFKECFIDEEKNTDKKITLLKYCFGENSVDTNNKITLLKVLSQYPFLLYKPIKEMAFIWHKEWLNTKIKEFGTKLWETIDLNDNYFDKSDDYQKVFSYDDFCELKFLFRRAVFIDNIQIIDTTLLELLSKIFIFIDKKRTKRDEKQPEQDEKRQLNLFVGASIRKKDELNKNLEDFPIFLIRNYLELIHKNGWVAVKLLENLNLIKDDFSTITARQFVRMLKIELAAVVNDFNDIIEKQFEKKWRDLFNTKTEEEKKNQKLITETNKIVEFFDKREDVLLKSNKFVILTRILGINEIKDNNELACYYWVKQLIFNETHPRTHIPPFDLHDKINAIVEKTKGFFPKGSAVESFFIVTDKQNTAYVMYDDNDNLYNFVGVLPPSHNETDKNWDRCSPEIRTINRVLYGMPDVQDIAVESIKEYRKKGSDEWNDVYLNTNETYPNEKINFDCLNGANYVLLVRFSELKDHKHRILGLMGFYCKIENCENDSEQFLLAKQLLMLLRQDIGRFIIKHHKNDEFSALRAAEVAKRFAYLSGHGRQTMQRLVQKNAQVFYDVVNTMEKLQFMYATNNIKREYDEKTKESIKDYLQKIFVFGKLGNKSKSIKEKIDEFIKGIYTAEEVENELKIKMYNDNDNTPSGYDTDIEKPQVNITDFSFSREILLFIVFELIINAKKNRWHCITGDLDKRCDCCRNNLKIEVRNGNPESDPKEDKKDLIIKVISTGTKIPDKIYNAINENKKIKPQNENEGLQLIGMVLNHLGSDRKCINVTSSSKSQKCKSDNMQCNNNKNNKDRCDYSDCCKLFENTITITVKPVKTNGER